MSVDSSRYRAVAMGAGTEAHAIRQERPRRLCRHTPSRLFPLFPAWPSLSCRRAGALVIRTLRASAVFPVPAAPKDTATGEAE